jgi:hypothetical protein
MRSFYLACTIFTLALLIVCGSENEKAEEQMQSPAQQGMAMEENQQMKSSEEWIRTQPIDVKALDLNRDGYVYQDPMDWNVIADEEGKCPKCGMFLARVTVDEAVKNLKDNGYNVK